MPKTPTCTKTPAVRCLSTTKTPTGVLVAIACRSTSTNVWARNSAVADLERGGGGGGGANICWPVAGHLVKGVILALVLAQ